MQQTTDKNVFKQWNKCNSEDFLDLDIIFTTKADCCELMIKKGRVEVKDNHRKECSPLARS